jgi:hypothetical protein
MPWSLGTWHSYIVSFLALGLELRATYLKKSVLFRLYLANVGGFLLKIYIWTLQTIHALKAWLRKKTVI